MRPPERGASLRGLVCRAVIYDDHLDGAVRLGEDTAHCFFE
jgi:hypothetical protein